MNSTCWMTTMAQPQSWLFPQPARTSSDVTLQLETVVQRFAPISLKQMERVALLNRVDIKFVLSNAQLLSVLHQLQPDYWMLSVQGNRLNRYRTLYFDTPDFSLYHAHVNERPERYKVRSREYTDSHLSFLEVKHHTRKDRTIKERIRTTQPVVHMTAAMGDWLRDVSPLEGASLEPKLWNTFTRITLVNKQCCERVTLDIDLRFLADERTVDLDGVAIAEVKLDSTACTSPFLAQMRAHRIRQRGFSKYAMGIALLYDQVKKNPLKPKMLWIDKLMKGLASDERSDD